MFDRIERECERANRHAEAILADDSGQMQAGIELAVGVLVVGLLTSYLLPVAIDEIVAVDTSSWGSAETSLWDLLPIFFVLAIVLFIVGWAMDARM